MGLEKDYTRITSITWKIIRDNKLNLIDAGDIIADAYLLFVEGGEEYSFDGFVKFIRKCIYKSDGTFETKNNKGVTKSRYCYSGQDHKYCRECNEVLPIACFRDIVHYEKNGLIIKSSYCNPCATKIARILKRRQIANLEDHYIIQIILSKHRNRYDKWTTKQLRERPKMIKYERNRLIKERKRREEKRKQKLEKKRLKMAA